MHYVFSVSFPVPFFIPLSYRYHQPVDEKTPPQNNNYTHTQKKGSPGRGKGDFGGEFYLQQLVGGVSQLVVPKLSAKFKQHRRKRNEEEREARWMKAGGKERVDKHTTEELHNRGRRWTGRGRDIPSEV